MTDDPNHDEPEAAETVVTIWSGFDYSYSLIFHGRSWRIHVPFPWHFAPDPVKGVVLCGLYTGGPRLGPFEALEAARGCLYGFRLVDEQERT